MARDYLYIFLNDGETGIAFGDEPTDEDSIRARLGDLMILNITTGEVTDKDGTRSTPMAAKTGGDVDTHTDLPPEHTEDVVERVTQAYEEYCELVDRGLCPLCKSKTDPFRSIDPEFDGVVATAHCNRCGWSDNES